MFYVGIDGNRKQLQKNNILEYVLMERICTLPVHDAKIIKMTVLIVDDSPLIIAKIVELLEDIEAITSVKTCGTYSDAVDMIDTYRPLLVLLDINLPDKNGIELLRYIKSNLPKIIVIMVTNQSSEYYKKLCFKMGADHFVDKSKDFEQLTSLVTSFL